MIREDSKEMTFQPLNTDFNPRTVDPRAKSEQARTIVAIKVNGRKNIVQIF